MSAKPIVYIVDDEEAVRTSLATLLDVHGFATRAYDSGKVFLEHVDPAGPGCALVDVKMPGLDGIDLLHKMAEGNIRVPVVMMTGFGEVATAVKAMKAGAVDFLEKPLDESELLTILTRHLSHSQISVQLEEQKEQALARLARLTEREREVFNGLAMGKTNKGIALDLGISPRTVEIHRARVMEKLEARSLSDLIRLGLVLEHRQAHEA
jgi:two-component system, LuxR family, response regulator FixJ